MGENDWQARAKRAGLSQKQLAEILGVAANTVSQQLRGRWQSGTPQYVKSMIVAWENMSLDARDRVLAEARGSEHEEGKIRIEILNAPVTSDRSEIESKLRVKEVMSLLVRSRHVDRREDLQQVVEERFPDTTQNEWREAIQEVTEFEEKMH